MAPPLGKPARIARGEEMKDIKTLEAIYKEKQVKYSALCDAAAAAFEAHQTIKAMCDEAMKEMHEAAEDYLTAMKQ